MTQVVEIFQFGAKRYGDESWKTVGNARNRYFSAAMRHLTAWYEGESHCKDSGKHHLAHCAWNILVLLWLDDHGFPD